MVSFISLKRNGLYTHITNLFFFKRERFQTGGGSCTVQVTAEQERLLAELQEQVEPLRNEFDNAAAYFCNDLVQFFFLNITFLFDFS